ncbi:hypothetical protein BD770DRAFT_389719 [Pilaira anomala]|nr:hypothetical protein BD770DRAFT_389719 [Pilaira anomala]
MIKTYFLLLIVFLSTLIYAEEATITSKIIPTVSGGSPPSGVVCAMTICPSASLLMKRELTCPSNCENNCRFIDDICCPGTQKAVCNNVVSGSTVVVTDVPTSAPTPKPTQSAVVTTSANDVPVPSNTITSGASSSAASLIAVISTCILFSFLTIGIIQ